MRRLMIVLSAFLFALVLASLTALSVGAQTTPQPYSGQDTTQQESTTQESTTQEPSPGAPASEGSLAGDAASGDSTSQGSIGEGPRIPEEDFPSYTQIVDDASADRFSAPGWETGSSDPNAYQGDYHVANPAGGAESAQFKFDIPATDVYSVYAWWPADAGNDAATRYGVGTSSGVEWTEVNQQKDGGFWVKLGEYEIEAGDHYAVQVAPASGGEGRAVADAVVVIRGVLTPPPDEAAGTPDGRMTAAGSRHNGRDVVRAARKQIGTKYVRSPPGRCRAFKAEDCACLTKVVFKKFDRRLPDDPIKQAKYGHKIKHKGDLRPGDLVFFKEGKSRLITHVGIYSGGGEMIHASRYWGKVVEKKMKSVDGFVFGTRLKPR